MSNVYRPSFKELFFSVVNRYSPYPIILIFKTYRKPYSVLANLVLKRYPFVAELKNGTKVSVTEDGINSIRKYALLYLAKESGKDINIVPVDNVTIKVVYDGQEVLLRDYRKGDVFGVFVFEEYGSVDVKDRTVIDCGAGIGESTIYFALKGARRVLAFEIDSQASKIAEDNMKLNEIKSAHIINAGCGKDGTYTIGGVQVPTFSLRTIVEKFQIEDDSVIKMDCEGCEYDLILNEKKETLSKFSEIIMEYHHGYNVLKKKLEKVGFKVNATKPVLVRSPSGNLILGRLYAYR